MPIISLYKDKISNFVRQTNVHSCMKVNATRLGFKISKVNNASFGNSIKALQSICKRAMKSNDYFGNCFIYLEARIIDNGQEPLTADAIICGYNKYHIPNLLIIENKEWSEDFASVPTNSIESSNGFIQTRYHDKDEDTGLRPHPSLQVKEYISHQNFIQCNPKNINGVVYCFRCEKDSNTYKALYDPIYKSLRNECIVYTKYTKQKLVDFMIARLSDGYGNKAEANFNL